MDEFLQMLTDIGAECINYDESDLESLSFNFNNKKYTIYPVSVCHGEYSELDCVVEDLK